MFIDSEGREAAGGGSVAPTQERVRTGLFSSPRVGYSTWVHSKPDFTLLAPVICRGEAGMEVVVAIRNL